MTEELLSHPELTDEVVGEQLRAAVGYRVDSVLGPAVASIPAFTRPNQKRGRSKVVAMSMCALTVLGFGTRQGLQLAKDRKPKELIVASDTPLTKSTEPRMVLRSDRYVLANLQRNIPDPTSGEALQLTSKTTEIYLQVVSAAEFNARSQDPRTTPIQVGSNTGRIDRSDKWWTIAWTADGVGITASGSGTPDNTLVDSFGLLKVQGDKRFAPESLPKGFNVKRMTQRIGYNVYYDDPKRQGFQNIVGIGVNLFEEGDGSMPTLDGPKVDGLTVSKAERNGRSYVLTSYQLPAPSKAQDVRVFWRDGNYVVSFSAPGSIDDVLALADNVQPATASEWKAAMATSTDEESRSTVLKKGRVDDEVGTKFTLQADAVDSSTNCRTVALRWNDLELGACLSDDSKELVRMLKVTNVEGQPVVFGILSDESPENQVVRITDAEGDVVGEEVAYDQRLLNGRAFAFPLDTRAVGPFTVELFDFDRAWYSENFDKTSENGSFVSDEAEPILQLPVSLEVPTAN
jgi:hypothetical protein